MDACLLSHVQLFVTLWTIAHQAPLSMGFSRQEYWSGLPCPPPGHLPDPGIKPISLMSPALASRFFTTSTAREAHADVFGATKSQTWLNYWTTTTADRQLENLTLTLKKKGEIINCSLTGKKIQWLPIDHFTSPDIGIILPGILKGKLIHGLL